MNFQGLNTTPSHRQPSPPARLKAVTPATLLLVVAFCALWAVTSVLLADMAMKADFLNLYAGATLAGQGRFGELHDQTVQLQIEREIVPGTTSLWPFVRPHFYAALLAPLSALPYSTAFAAWTALNWCALIGCWVWAAKRFGADALVFGAMYLPTALGIGHGQDSAILLAIVTAGYALAEKRRDFVAGLVVSFGLIKFHLLLLLPLAMWINGRRRMFAGYITGAAVLTGVSMLLAGSHGVSLYWSMLTDPRLQGLHPSPEKTISVRSLLLNFDQESLWLFWPLVIAVLVAGFIAVRGAPLWRWWSAACLASLLAPPHVYGYDAALLLLGIWLTAAHSSFPPSRIIGSLLAAPLVFGIGLVGKPLSAVPAAMLMAYLVALAFENQHDASATQDPGDLSRSGKVA